MSDYNKWQGILRTESGVVLLDGQDMQLLGEALESYRPALEPDRVKALMSKLTGKCDESPGSPAWLPLTRDQVGVVKYAMGNVSDHPSYSHDLAVEVIRNHIDDITPDIKAFAGEE